MLETILKFKGTWRTYQQRVLDRYDIYSQDGKIHIVAAPGSGKTTLGIELMIRINQPTLVLVPSITIREQWMQRICDVFLIDPTQKDRYLSQDLKQPKLITIATYQALHSAMLKYCGELVEEQDECKTLEQVDYHDFDILQCFKQHTLGTLCLDECHHLRNEWWKSLEQFKQTFSDIFTVSLTATPPYDSEINLWNRYMNMCGDIDEEITVPELVKDGTLCPHQDYVYFNYPTREEKEKLQVYKKDSHEIFTMLMQDDTFCDAIKTHRFFVDYVTSDELLDKPSYLSSMIIFLNEKHYAGANKYKTLLGYTSLEPMSLKWMEILLQGFLYDDVASFRVEDTYREQWIHTLKSRALIEKKNVSLTLNKNIEKMLINSVGKCESIKKIVQHEYKHMKSSLRLLILTDYIRKEYECVIGTDSDVSALGVIPFFEQLRRACIEEDSTLRLGVLCGSIIIIPQEAQKALLNIVNDKDSVRFLPISNIDDYVKVEVKGTSHVITAVISTLFEQGYMQVLIGTKSLLGEGWDSPCVNALILASFVGSYMLSNQMRGRAIRVCKQDPNKTSNIWHLVCVNQVHTTTAFPLQQTSEDYETLCRRMQHFLGLHYVNDTIESGMERMNFIEPPFTSEHVKKINRTMLELAKNRTILKQRWERSLAIYDSLEVVDESEVKEKFVSAVILVDALRILLVILIAGIIGFMISISLMSAFDLSMIFLYSTIYIIVVLIAVLSSIKKVFTVYNPMSRLKLFGEGIRSALAHTGQLDCIHSRVEVEGNEGVYAIYLLGGTGRDKTLFTKCVSEFYEDIDNQRYILYKEKRKNKMDGYFSIPSCFSKRKEDAVAFASYMKPFVGTYDTVYTRNEEGRKILLKGRVKAFVNRQNRCVNRKKVKGALE